MLKYLISAFAVALALTAGAAESPITLAADGRSGYVIVVPADAIPAEQTAGQELQRYLKQISGVELPIVSAAPPAAKRILVGQSAEIAALLGGIEFAKLKPDEIIIRTVGDTLILTGQRPRGTLYAVNTFLEDTLGVRWWTANETLVPSVKNIGIAPLNVRYAPPFMIREAYYGNIVFSHPEFAVHTKNNGHSEGIAPEWGGNYTILGFCHTFDQLLPAAEYFKAHPEWYAMIDGKRKGKDAQLCLSNAAMREELVKRAKNWLRDNPGQNIISITQNDNSEYCRCPQCVALSQRLGGESDVLILFVNSVAEELEKKFPGVQVETLAYMYTVEAPKSVRPRENVIIRLCTMGANVAQPIYSEANRRFSGNVEAWSRISAQLAIWEYTANFTNSLVPHANLSNMANNLRYFSRHHVVSVFDQGNPHSDGLDDLTELKAWFNSKLLWNPQLDSRALIDEFITGYYGPAAPYVRQYVELLELEASQPQSFISNDAADTSGWLSLPTLLKAIRLMDQARDGVKNDPVLSARVRRSSLSSRFGLLTRMDATRWNNNPRSRELVKDIDLEGMMRQTFAEAKEFRTGQESPLNTLMERLPKAVGHAKEIPVPDFCKNLQTNDWMVIPNELFTALCEPTWTSRVKDERASNGTAVCQSAEYPIWSIQNSLGAAAAIQPEWRIYLAVRCETGSPQGDAFLCGVYDNGTIKYLGGRGVATKDILGQEYRYVDLGVFKLTPSCILWTQPTRSNDLKIYFDRMILVKAK